METANLSLQEKLEIISKDFLERDGETFTFERKEGRLGWEKKIGEGGAYSEYILHPESQEELISSAYRIASDMITVMDTPFKVNIVISDKQSCTNSKKVFVATKVFDDPDLSIGHKLDVFIGLTVHEGCHLLYTDFHINPSDMLEKTLANIIEDERIERACGDSKPGLVNFIKASKYYYFDKYYQEFVASGANSGLDTFKRLLNTILSYIRYPKSLDRKDTEEFADVLLKSREILVPYPENSFQSLEAARKIAQLIRDFLKNEKQEQKKQNGNDSKNSGTGRKRKKKDSKNNSQTSDSESGQSQPEQSQGSEHNSDAGKKVQNDINNDLSELQDALSNIAEGPKNCLEDKDKSEVVDRDGGKVGLVCAGEIDRGLQNGAYIHKGTSDESVYKTAYDEIKKYIPAISKVLRMSSTEYKLSLRGMRSGVLDTGKLAEAYQGVNTVYMREGEVRTDRVSVCILIDESGSMWGDGEKSARETAVLLNEALDQVGNVDLYIYGHTATRHITDLFIYREQGFKCRYALGSTDSRAGNHDSIAIREACARVRKYTKDRCLFFMISDGAPNERPELVRQAVKEVERDDFNVVAISIDPYYDPSIMYSKNVTLKDMSTLALEIGKIVKKSVMNNTQKKINM